MTCNLCTIRTVILIHGPLQGGYIGQPLNANRGRGYSCQYLLPVFYEFSSTLMITESHRIVRSSRITNPHRNHDAQLEKKLST